MEMHYSAHVERLSFAAKHVLIEACRQTAKARAATDRTGSWNPSCGEVPARCSSFDTLRAEAMRLAVDIDAQDAENVISIHFLAYIEGSPPYSVETAERIETATGEESDSNSISSSTEESNVGEEADHCIHEHMEICRSVTLIQEHRKVLRRICLRGNMMVNQGCSTRGVAQS